MNTTPTLEGQSLVDIAVQEYGSAWMDGLIALQKYNTVNLVNNPEPTQVLKVKDRDEENPVYQTLKRDRVKVATVPKMFTGFVKNGFVKPWFIELKIFSAWNRST